MLRPGSLLYVSMQAHATKVRSYDKSRTMVKWLNGCLVVGFLIISPALVAHTEARKSPVSMHAPLKQGLHV